MPALLSLLVTLVILGLLFYLVVWLISWVAVPAPFDKIIKAVVGLIFVLYLISILLGAPWPQHWWRG